jgi:SNF2 family DNA or RNA helicase
VDYLVRSSFTEERIAVGARRKRKKKAQTFDSVHDQWLHALRSVDGEMEADASELAGLAAQIRSWRRPVSVTTSVPFRLCFRLEEPQSGTDAACGVRAGQGVWKVCYMLQAGDDPSLLIPAGDAWNPRGRKKAILKRGNFNAREYLLTSLGQASGLCPHVEASLKAPAPGGYELDATGAYDFLTEKALLLEQSGFGVMLPAWWTRKGTKLRLSVRANVRTPKMQGGGELSLGSIIRFDWEMALGKEKLAIEELEALAKLKAPLVQVRGQWVQMTAEEIQTAIDFWKAKDSSEATVRDVIQMALGAKEAVGGFEFGGLEATGWIGKLLKQLDGRVKLDQLPVPQEFSGTLRPYQLRGYSWLSFLGRWGLGACLADDMGLGKTIQALALIQRDWHSDGKRPVLIICPTSVVANWGKEAQRFTPELPVMVHHGPKRARGSAFKKKAGKHAIVISSYALLHRDFDSLKQTNWAGVILDEAQNIKNPETKQSKAARSLRSDYRMALTGTPVENNVGDLWSIMEFLNSGFLGSQTQFKKKFFIPIQAGRDPQAAKRLKRITGPFILRRLKTDKSIISDLPEKMEMKVFCTLTKEQASLYAAVVKDASEGLNSAEGIGRKGIILATLSKLKQVCNHPTQFLGDNSPIPGRSGKLARLTEMIEEIIEVDDRALIFSQFAEMGKILKRHLQETFGREVLFLHGGVPRKKREVMIERFQSKDDGTHIFILSLKAGGTGLNLTRANHVFHFDRWWNPAVENQATDRAFRIGQTRNVQVHKFLCVGTLEEKIDEMIERKKEIAASVVGTGEKWLTELSNNQLKELFALRKEAVAE